MDLNRRIQLIRQYVGIDFLVYVLNINNEVIDTQNFDNTELNETQKQILDNLYSNIQECRLQFVMRGGFGDSIDFYLRNQKHGVDSLYNAYRKVCGGLFPAISDSEDELKSFLFKLCIREYPNLLIKSVKGDYSSSFSINIGVEEFQEFNSIVKNDVIDNLANDKEDLEYSFSFYTTDGQNYQGQICNSASIIISRAFHNCCFRFKYSLPDVLYEISANIDVLRSLVKNEEITYSSFIGIKGLIFDDFDLIDFESAIIRQANCLSNPSHQASRTFVMHTDSSQNKRMSGHFLEIFNRTKVSQVKGDYTVIQRNHDVILDAIKFSIIFSLLEDKGLTISFSENGFPIMQPGNFSFTDDHPQKYINIKEQHIASILEWYQILVKKDLEKVRVPIDRLRFSIFERKKHEDSIVDAIIAWEGMFSEAFETSFKVTGSISRFLVCPEEREEFYSRLRKLYSLRSDIVHGKQSRFMKKENIEELRSEVIKIGIECLKKILKDDELLNMSPAERVKEIMINR